MNAPSRRVPVQYEPAAVAAVLAEMLVQGPYDVGAFVAGHTLLLDRYDMAAAVRLACGLGPGAALDALTARQRTNMGLLHLYRGEVEQAVRVLDTARSLGDPEERTVADIYLGSAYQALGDDAAAVSALERAVGSGTRESGFAAQALAMVVAHDEPDRAVELLAFAARQGGTAGGQAAFNLAVLLAERGDRDGAERAYRQAIEEGTHTARTWAANNLGNLLKRAGRPESAEAAFRIAIAEGLADSAVNLGLMFAELGRDDDALAAYRTAVAMPDPDQQARALTNIGELFLAAGRLEEAEHALQEALATGHPEHSWRARFDLGSALANLGRRREARRHWEICLTSPVPRVADTARACLADLDRGVLPTRPSDETHPEAPEPGQLAESLAQQLCNTDTWTDARALLLAHPENTRVIAEALARNTATAEAQGHDGDAYAWRQHQRLVERCVEIGIDAAFAEKSGVAGMADDGLAVRYLALTDAIASHRAAGTRAESAARAAAALLDDPRWRRSSEEFRARALVLAGEATDIGGLDLPHELRRRIIGEMRELWRRCRPRFMGLLPHNLAAALLTYRTGGVSLANADEAVKLLDAIEFARDAAPDGQALIHSLLAEALAYRAGVSVETRAEDFERALALAEASVRHLAAARQLGRGERSQVRGRVSRVLELHYDLTRERNSLDRAIALSREVADDCGPAHRLAAVYKLSGLLLDRRNVGDTAAAVTLLGEAAELAPGGSELHEHIVYRLCETLLEDGYAAGADALPARRVHALIDRRLMEIDSATTRSRCRTAILLVRLFEHTGQVALVQKAVQILEATLDAGVDGEDAALAAQVHGLTLGILYEATGDVDALHRSATLLQALATGNPPDPERIQQYGTALYTLGIATGELFYFDQAIDVLRAGYGERAEPEFVRQLAIALENRGHRLNDIGDLSEAVSLHRELYEATDPQSALRWRHAADLATAQLRLDDLAPDPAMLDEAITSLRDAVDGRPTAQVGTRPLHNLASVLMRRYEQTRAPGVLDEAIPLLERCVSHESAASALLPMHLAALGEALTLRHARDGSEEDAARATATLRAACTTAVEQGFPLRRGARIWARWAGDRGAWAEAVEAAELGLAHHETSVRTQLVRDHKEAVVAELGWLSCLGGYAYAQLGDTAAAAVIVERGLAAMLSDALEREPADLGGLQDAGRGDLVRRYHDHTHAIAELETLLDPSNRGVRRPGAPGGAAGQWAEPLKRRHEDLKSLIDEIREVDGFGDFLKPPGLQDIYAAAEEQPLVYVLATPWGGLALTVERGGDRPGHVELPLERDKADLLAAYLLSAKGPAVLPAISVITAVLWTAVMRPVLLAMAGHRAITLVPAGSLSFLPFHAARGSANLQPAVDDTYALDLMRVTYAPNARTLSQAAHRARGQRGPASRLPTRLLAVDDPEPGAASLRTDAEMTAALRRFPDHIRLRGGEATVAGALEHLPSCDVLHFACHGDVSLLRPLDSSLRLSGGERLRIGTLMDTRIDARLSVLSACSTNVSGINSSYESVNLSSAFLVIGAAGVIASQWQVPDEATNLLMAAFYGCWEEDTEPSEALRRAQLWLRDSTNQELQERFPDAVGPGPSGTVPRLLWLGTRPYAHPYFWAGFTYTGH
ncbi:CHAT domain-containing protein [Streptomyces sp. NBC_01276]|uniref:CHAT domain-containing protein n=1 Tax=Streptomyces sp. NBC_01276 TaxID=2903808 RepID=UPI00352DC6EC